MFKFAFGNLLSRPVRSVLSILGLTVAIAGMVGLFSIAGGIDSLVKTTFEQIPGVLVQQRGAPIPLFSTLPNAWGRELEQIPGVAVVNPEILTRVNLIDGQNIISPPRFLLGLDIPTRLQLREGVYDDQMEQGRFLELEDIGTMNAVISREISEEFDKTVGDDMEINGYAVTITGVYHAGSLLLDSNIVMDLDAVRTISRYDPQSVSCFYVEQTGEISDQELQQNIEDHFRDRSLEPWRPSMLMDNPLVQLFQAMDNSIKATAPDARQTATREETDSDLRANGGSTGEKGKTAVAAEGAAAAESESAVEVRTADEWAERFDEFSGDLDLFLLLMTTIGVVIAVLSIVNTMLMSVTERTIEFGILRANGWSRTDILRLVTFESAFLGLTGGLLGAAFGWLATLLINWKWPERIHLHAGPGLIVFSIVFSLLLGVLGGVYPAWLAARMSPMAAIRRS